MKQPTKQNDPKKSPPACDCPPPTPPRIEDDRTGMEVETFSRAIADNLHFIQGKDELFATPHDYYMALAYTVRDRLIHRWIHSVQTCFRDDAKVVFYLSAEFLMGRQLANNLVNIDCWKNVHQALEEAGLELDELLEMEPDPGLGNGGLGRLAACYLDSLATLEIPAFGYGIRYEFGIFEQTIRDGWQIEKPDKWLRLGNPWEIARPERAVTVNFGGHTELFADEHGRERVRWMPERTVLGIPYDTLVPGYHVNTVNTLRLWSANASQDFDLQFFNDGDYNRAVADKTKSENISKVLYPNDNNPAGKELRLQQQYFFVSCSLQDLIAIHLLDNLDLHHLPERAAVQLNDTHPALAVAELMRLLVDLHLFDWDDAWTLTTQTLGYTNHTLLPEALERWPTSLFGRLLPRHLEIVFEINRRFLDDVRTRHPGDLPRLARLSLIEEGSEKLIRMAHLACVGCHTINGVAKLHTELLQSRVLADFHQLDPDKFVNITNGVTPRRWLLVGNPKLADLLTSRLGDGWAANLERLTKLETVVDDPEFRDAWRQVKQENKQRLATLIRRQQGLAINPAALFDVQVKRIHEYKRQLLLALYAVTIYNRIKRQPNAEPQTPRVCLFAGKAAPGYTMAKLIIKLINSIASVVNRDPAVGDRLKVVFLPNFCVSLGERIYPAADLSEQISTAGMEASGTGNMKFALNGAVTIGTLDGANIEIRNQVGADNFFLFGLTVDQIDKLRRDGYQPRQFFDRDPELQEAMARIAEGHFSGGDQAIFWPILDALLGEDRFMVCADYRAYVDCQDRVANAFQDQEAWTTLSILNTARMGHFSSDRAIQQYCERIWNAKPVPVTVDEYRPGNAKLSPVCHLDQRPLAQP